MILIGIGDFGATADPGEVIKTMALGSCVAVILLDPRARVGGMVHIALPDSTLNPEKRLERPGYFADSGIPSLLKAMVKAGSSGDIKGMYVKIAGGANVLKAANSFDIGKRNIIAVKRALWSLGTGPVAEDVGGTFSRTVTVFMESGKTEISCPSQGKWYI